jgi:hypothetical protein
MNDSPQRRYKSPYQKSYVSYKIPCNKVADPSDVKLSNLSELSRNELEQYYKAIFSQYVYSKQCHQRRSRHRTDYFPDPADWDEGHTIPITKNMLYEQDYLDELEKVASFLLNKESKEIDDEKKTQPRLTKKGGSSSSKRGGKKGSRQQQKKSLYQYDQDAEIEILRLLELEEEDRLLVLDRRTDIIVELFLDTVSSFGKGLEKQITPDMFSSLCDHLSRITFNNKGFEELSDSEFEQLQDDIKGYSFAQFVKIIVFVKKTFQSGKDYVKLNFVHDDIVMAHISAPINNNVGYFTERPFWSSLKLNYPPIPGHILTVTNNLELIDPSRKIGDAFKSGDSFSLIYMTPPVQYGKKVKMWSRKKIN